MIILYHEVAQKHETEIPDALESCGKVKKSTSRPSRGPLTRQQMEQRPLQQIPV